MPLNWGAVTQQDVTAVASVLRNMINLHNTTNDAPAETAVDPKAITDVHMQISKLLYYRLLAFGYRNPLTLEDFMALRNCHPRVLGVEYLPMAQGRDPGLFGALCVLVSTAEYDRDRQMAQNSIPSHSPIGSPYSPQQQQQQQQHHHPNGTSTALVLVENNNLDGRNKKRKTIGEWIDSWFPV